MASTFFQDYNQNTPVVSTWLNDVNADVYTPSTGIPASPGGTARTAVQQAAAWARFSVSGGVITILQSVGIASITYISVGLYQINYLKQMVNAQNCYSMSCGQAAFAIVGTETQTSTQISFQNPTASATIDPANVSFAVFGAN